MTPVAFNISQNIAYLACLLKLQVKYVATISTPYSAANSFDNDDDDEERRRRGTKAASSDNAHIRKRYFVAKGDDVVPPPPSDRTFQEEMKGCVHAAG